MLYKYIDHYEVENQTIAAIKFYFEDTEKQPENITRNALIAKFNEVHEVLKMFAPSNVFIGIKIRNKLPLVPLILGINKHHCAFFCFNPEENDNSFHNDIIKKLNIKWILTTDPEEDSNIYKTVGQIDVFNITVTLIGLIEDKFTSQDTSLSLSYQDLKFNDFCYAITTSGTTGEPKIVCVPHCCIMPNILDFRNLFNLTRKDVILFNTPITFDPFIIEVFLAITTGATLVVTEKRKFTDCQIQMLFENEKITFLQCTPSLFLSLQNDTLKKLLGKDSSLRILALGGEMFPSLSTLCNVKSVENKTDIYNLYGLTEMSCWASTFKVDSIDEFRDNYEKQDSFGGKIPIGMPLRETEFYLDTSASLDDNFENKIDEKYIKILSTNLKCDKSKNISNSYESQNLLSSENISMDQDMCKKPGKIEATKIQAMTEIRKSEANRGDNSNSYEDIKGELIIRSKTRLVTIIEKDNIRYNIQTHRTGDVVTIKDGKIYFLSRKQNIIKRYGHRIFLNRIEEFSREFLKSSCYCVYVKTSFKIILFILNSHKNMIPKLQKTLREKLPIASQVDEILTIAEYPLTANGKIDRRKLLNQYISMINRSKEYAIEPSTDFVCVNDKIENLCSYLKKILCRYLNIENNLNSISESPLKKTFKQLGGTSIIALQIANEFNKTLKFGAEVKLLEKLFDETITMQEILDFLINNKITCKRKSNFNEAVHNASKKFIQHRGHQDESSKYDVFHIDKLVMDVDFTVDLKGCVDATAVVFRLNDSEILACIGSHAHELVLVNILDKSIIFQITLPDRIEGSACIHSNQIFIGCYNGCLYCIDLKTGQINWTYFTQSRIKSTPVILNSVFGDSIVFGSYDRYIYCVSLNSQKLLWKMLLNAPISSSPVIFEEKIYIANIQGVCFCLNKTTGAIVWQVSTNSPIFGSACIIPKENLIAWPNVNGVISFINIQNGIILTYFQASNAVFSSLKLFNDNFILFGCHDGFLYCLKIQNGECCLEYKVNLNGEVFSTPEVFVSNQFGAVVIAVNTRGEVFICQHENVAILLKYDLNSEVFSSPVLCDDKLLIGCRDNKFYSFKLSNF